MDSGSSITVTNRSDLSLLYRVLRVLIRPLRPRLVSPGKPLPAGSPKLHPPGNANTKEEQVHGLHQYRFSPPTTSSNKHHNLFYFAGGGFQSPPSSEHWKICRVFANELADIGCTVTLVSYPLAPNSPAPQSLPVLRQWLSKACAVATQNGESVILAGDSAGGNVVLNLGLWWANEVVHDPALSNPVKQILAISPATDLRNENPEIEEADKVDPVLSIGLTTDVGQKWAGTWGVDNPDVSPNLSPHVAALKDAQIHVNGVVGTADVLAPDALVFKGLCEKHSVSGNWLVWQNQMHCFPLASVYGLSEGKAGRDWILDVLRKHLSES